MSAINQPDQAPAHLANGSAPMERLQTRILELEEECEKLRRELVKVGAQRNLYHQALLAELRDLREFEDADIPTLEAMSAGSVEMIE